MNIMGTTDSKITIVDIGAQSDTFQFGEQMSSQRSWLGDKLNLAGSVASLSYALAAFGCLPALAFATTPTISNVSGTVQTGQTLTITGTSMVQEDRTNWDPFFATTHPSASGFEGSSPTADSYGTSCGSNLSYDSTVQLLGSQSIKMHDSGQHIHDYTTGSGSGGCMWGYAVQAAQGQGPADVYFRTYSRWNNTSWPDNTIKYWWMGNLTGNWAFYNLHASSDGSAPTQWGFSSSGLSAGAYQFFNIPGGAIQNNKWYLFEAHFRRAGSGNYIFEGWIDNQLMFSLASSDGPGKSNTGNWESNVNYWNTTASFVSNQWQDGFAISSTRIGPASLIEIGNSATYASGTKVYQEPIYLSDGSVQMKLNLSGLGSGPYYLWVTNNRKERSQPYNLSSGQTTLAPPSGLMVTP